MEECVSIWPDTLEGNNFRRGLFKRGMAAASTVQIAPSALPWDSPIEYIFTDPTISSLGRVPTEVLNKAQGLFSIVNSSIVEEIGRIARDHQWDTYLQSHHPTKDIVYLEKDSRCLAEMQIFVMGFYYALLKPLLDISQLTAQEAYGEWQWNDYRFLLSIQSIRSNCTRSYQLEPNGISFTRQGIFRLLAILFAGAEEAQMEAMNAEVIGLHGKLTLLAASMLGHADSNDTIRKFHLLDMDATAIPSNVQGIIQSGTFISYTEPGIPTSEDKLQHFQSLTPDSLDEDFSSHIEPDWDNDVQTCQIVFRYKGRIVRRFSPTQIEDAIYRINEPYNVAPKNKSKREDPKTLRLATMDGQLYIENVEGLFDRKFPVDDPESSQGTSLWFPTKGRSKARACLQTIYHDKAYRSVWACPPYAEVELQPPEFRAMLGQETKILHNSEYGDHIGRVLKQGLRCALSYLDGKVCRSGLGDRAMRDLDSGSIISVE